MILMTELLASVTLVRVRRPGAECIAGCLASRKAVISVIGIRPVHEFIEIYYNRVRRHSANGWVTPAEFERLYYQNLEPLTVY
ncbi:hypothetical protein D7I39_07085 [Allopusillimonas ginsengisoli]|nr:hypothetical protein D7I39_07085 [Allopusillimonas ginsengisoli]